MRQHFVWVARRNRTDGNGHVSVIKGRKYEKMEHPNGGQHEHIVAVLHEALPYINRLQKKVVVVKLGGSTLERDRDVLEDAMWLQRVGALPVIVHGGGPSITHWLERIGHESRFVNGRRVTDEVTLQAAEMVLIG